MLDLMQIKEALEDAYDAEFAVIDKDYMEGKELLYKKEKDSVRVHISRYTCLDERLGKEFIGYDYWNGTGGNSAPCDSMEELFKRLDRIGMPRRTAPRDKMEQLSLW